MKNFFNGKSIFITGHTGFKGSWLCAILTELGAKVTGYALAPDELSHFKLNNIENLIEKSYIADVNNLNELSKAVIETKPEIIFHMAAQAYVRRSYKDPIDTYQTNVMGTLNLLEAARKTNSVKVIVNVTTDKCYENREWDRAYSEDDRLGGHDIYSSSKACSEILTSSYRRSFFPNNEVRIATARAGNVIGGGDFSEDRIIPDIVRSIKENAELKLRHPNAVRPWQHVLDCLQGYMLLAQKLYEEGGEEYIDSYNFAPINLKEYKVKDITEIFIKTIGKGSFQIEQNANNVHEAQMLKLDPAKAVRTLNWQPVFDTETSVEYSVSWYKNYVNDNKVITSQQIKEYLEKL